MAINKEIIAIYGIIITLYGSFGKKSYIIKPIKGRESTNPKILF